MNDEKKVRRKYKPRGRANISALEDAGKEASAMSESPDKDLAHVGEVVARITGKLCKSRKEQLAIQKQNATSRGSKKIFYTSAHASAIEDD
jgi:hypothetical protein